MICGIDPGLKGGIAFLDRGIVLANRTPILKTKVKKKAKTYLDVGSIVALLLQNKPSHIYIEKQQAMPRQGVASTFMTGFGYGIYLGIFITLGIKYTEVSPSKWKKDLHVTSDKDQARERATQIFPNAAEMWSLKCEDGVAEAAMIAYWGAKFHMDQSDQYEQAPH